MCCGALVDSGNIQSNQTSRKYVSAVDKIAAWKSDTKEQVFYW